MYSLIPSVYAASGGESDPKRFNSAMIGDATINSAKIADSSITNAKIADAAIDSAKIADAAITAAKIGDAAIKTAKIGIAEIDTLRIANHSVTVHAHAEAAFGEYYNGHAIACTIQLNQPATLSIFVQLGEAKHQFIPSYKLNVNGSLFKIVSPQFVSVYGGSGGTEGSDDYYFSESIGGINVYRIEVGAGVNTVSLTNNIYSLYDRFLHRTLLVMASMR